jgi:NtrC-family two-component system sensor histidine kinase KinB
LTSVEAVVDPRQLEKVFFNLISNAIKFTPAGGKVVVDMMLKQKAVEIRVKDSGRGIPAKDLNNVFAPFFQLGNHGNGHGIGLVLSK